MSLVSTPMSVGELLDKITILEIKSREIKDEGKLKNIRHELALLQQTWQATGLQTGRTDALQKSLEDINMKLWRIEDDIRLCEKDKDFGDAFVQLARSVYFTNDERAAIKKQINQLTGSDLVEEKSYESYD